LGDLVGVVVAVVGEEGLGGVPGFGGEDGDGDGERGDGEEVGPEDDSLLFGEVYVGFDVHLRLSLRGFAVFGGLELVQADDCLLFLHIMNSCKLDNKIEASAENHGV
jgi:hypothetical protein